MINIFKGILISISLLVPGVSGGTMMIILGVFDKSIEALSALISGKLLHIKLVIQLAIGGIIGLVLFSKSMLWALEKFPFAMAFFFLGIVLFGLSSIIKRVRWSEFKAYHILFLLGGGFLAFIMTFGESSALFEFGGSFIQKIIMILIAGIIIAVALILPGISTSFLLLALGLYEETLTAINNLDWGFILPLGIGVICGVLLTTKLLEYLMKEHPTPTYLAIIGFVLGSIGEIYPGWPVAFDGKITSVIAFVLGAILMLLIQMLMRKYPEHED